MKEGHFQTIHECNTAGRPAVCEGIEMKELKSEKVSMRFTESRIAQISGWPGKNFSEKLEGIMNYFFVELPEIRKEVEELTLERDKLKKQISRLKEVSNQINTMVYALSVIEDNLEIPKVFGKEELLPVQEQMERH